MMRIEDHPGVLAMLQALASDPHAIAPAAAAGFAERAIELIEALLTENGRYDDALRDIEVMPEQGGCDDGPDAVDLWMLMRMRAERALNGEP
ncbi:MAG TPA: hypothetical protein DHW63_00355 [Hyphomonadaceae bacterium]|nr:hypothetical protein [Hyphomonadaceae bacterium]